MGGRRAGLEEYEAAVDAVYLLLHARNRGTESVSAVLKRHGVAGYLRQAMEEAGMIEGTHSSTRWLPDAPRPDRDAVRRLHRRALDLVSKAVARSRENPSGREPKPQQLSAFSFRSTPLKAVPTPVGPKPAAPSLEGVLRDAYRVLGEAEATIRSVREQLAGVLPDAKEATND